MELFRKIIKIAMCFLCLAGCRQAPQRPVAFSDLVARLTNETVLARFDQPGGKLLSSFDPTGGNDDFNHPLREGPDGWVVWADLKGPGYISRFWSTGADDGDQPLRFYFDGENTPRIETTMDVFFHRKGDAFFPLAGYEPFCWYSFLPVAYQKRLVVMTRKGGFRPDQTPKLFHQISYCPLPANTVVEEKNPLDLNDMTALLDEVRMGLRQPVPMARAAGVTGYSNAVVLKPGTRSDLLTMDGPAMVRSLTIRPSWRNFASVVQRDMALRNIILRIYWDESPAPSVEVPLGDFFGSVWRPRQYMNFYFGMTNGDYICRFPMPFARKARIEIENQSSVDIPMQVDAAVMPLPAWRAGEWGYFHAAWNKTGPHQVGTPHTFLSTKGRGFYVGCLLAVTSMEPEKGWWILEGDETIRVDDEKFPGWHGTGLEDYFNGGWYYGRPIIRPFNGLPLKSHFRTIQYRIHQLDPVAFKQSIDVNIERGPDHACRGWMESMAFYYLDQPGSSASSLGDVRWREAPVDTLEPMVVMTTLNDLEMLGDRQGAEDYLQSVLERWPDHPYAPVFRLRRLLYEEPLMGVEALKNQVKTFRDATPHPLARQQADDWLWFQESTNHALLMAYCNSRSDIYLDGRGVGASGDPQRVQMWRVEITPGRHVVALACANRGYPFWAQANLRTHYGDVPTTVNWKFAYGPGGNWPAVGYDDSQWVRVGGTEFGKGPPEEPWVAQEPQAWPGLQSRARGLVAVGPWADVTKRAVFRGVFTISPSGDLKAPGAP
jgi:hypothetical protein